MAESVNTTYKDKMNEWKYRRPRLRNLGMQILHFCIGIKVEK